jgi:Flp pilus assembly protein TadG
MWDRRKGSAVVETALMMPWLVFLFVGILDFGFYSYAAICTQNASRAAGIAASANAPTPGQTAAAWATATQPVACAAALLELNRLPSAPANCTGIGNNTNTRPVAVYVTQLNKNTLPKCADCVPDTAAISAQVWVTYETIPMIPIPRILTGRMTLNRISEMRILQ